MALAFVVLVAVALLSEAAVVGAVLALEVVGAGVEERGLVGELRLEVSLAVAAALAFDSAAERWRREAVGRGARRWGSVRRSWDGAGGRRSEALVRIGRARVSVAARAGFVIVVVGGHASVDEREGEGVFLSQRDREVAGGAKEPGGLGSRRGAG